MEKKKLIAVGIIGLFIGMVSGALGTFAWERNHQRAALSFAQGQDDGLGRGMMKNGGRWQRGDGNGAPQIAVQQNGGGAAGRVMNGGQRNGMLAGEILSKDDKSFTLKMSDGNSRIVFYADTTTIGKSIPATSSDLSVGQSVRVSGQGNNDGSIVAHNIQLTPLQDPSSQQ